MHLSYRLIKTLQCSLVELWLVNSLQNGQHFLNPGSLQCLSSDASKEALKKVESCFEQLENPFSYLNTESKRTKHFKEKWKIVEPVEYILGVRFESAGSQNLLHFLVENSHT